MTELPENLAFIPRGKVNKTIDFHGYEVKVTLNILNNRESNELYDKHTHIDELEGTYKLDAVSLVEERLFENLIDINIAFNGKAWTELTDKEKQEALECMNPELREMINNEIIAKASLTDEERDFLQKQ